MLYVSSLNSVLMPFNHTSARVFGVIEYHNCGSFYKFVRKDFLYLFSRVFFYIFYITRLGFLACYIYICLKYLLHIFGFNVANFHICPVTLRSKANLIRSPNPLESRLKSIQMKKSSAIRTCIEGGVSRCFSEN